MDRVAAFLFAPARLGHVLLSDWDYKATTSGRTLPSGNNRYNVSIKKFEIKIAI
jgi:hypothetical protein